MVILSSREKSNEHLQDVHTLPIHQERSHFTRYMIDKHRKAENDQRTFEMRLSEDRSKILFLWPP